MEGTAMKVTRKFNLARIGHQYESIDIEVEGEDIGKIILEITEAWKAYLKAIVDGVVQ
jgi:hypothetical protein